MNLVKTQPPAWLAQLCASLDTDTAGWSTHGRLELKVDAHPRVTLRPGRGHNVLFECRVGRLPAEPMRREALLDALMLRVCAGALRHTAVLALASDEELLVLQATLSDEPGARGGAEALRVALNELDYWSAVVRRHA